MGTIRTSWWRHTGDYAPFDEVGIARAIYLNSETGESVPSDQLPIGALWILRDELYPKGGDGLAVACRLPGGVDWHIDGRASNCPMPDDKEHRCWVRHGTFGEPLTVDKNGRSCAAGAGSIAVHGYHGFLRNGELVDA